MYSENNEIKENFDENDINDNKRHYKEDENEIKNEIKNKNIQLISKDIAETVVTLILDKIILNIIVEAKIKEIYSNLSGHCFKYIHKLMSSYLRNNFIFHENGIDNLSYQQNLVFFDKKPINKINNWEQIKEPLAPEFDRHITGKNKVIKLTKKEEIDYINKNEKEINISDINSMQINSKDEIEEINNSLKESIDKINIKKVEKKEKEEKKKKKKYKIKKTFGEIVREKEAKEKENSKKNQKDKIYKKSEEKDKNIKEDEDDEDSFVLAMTAHDLNNIDNTCNNYNNNEENDLLRKEREKLLIQKEKERLKEEERKKKEKKKKFKLQIKKNFESNILTFDPNGEIIRKRLVNLDIIKKDFKNPKLKIKDNNITKSLPIEKRRSILRPIKEQKSNNKNISKNNSQNEKIIFNPNDKIKLFDFEKNKMKNNSNKEIKISGNNFELVKPEVGVVISNEIDNRKKEGGFQYFKKYNKPSMKDYSKLSLFSGNLLSSYLFSSDNNIDINDNYKDENNYIGFKEEFNENNPLFQDVYKIPSLNQTKNNIKDNENKQNQNININNLNVLKNKKVYLKTGKNKNKNNFIHSYDSIKINNNRYKNYNSNNSIKVNENIINNNLKNIFEENEENNFNKKYNSIDINSYSYLRNKAYILKGKKGLKRRRELPIITENNGKKDILDEFIDVNQIDKFNFRIIKNKKWGNDIDSDPLFQNKNKFIKSDNNYLQTDGNINIFRKGNISNRIKESGVNAIYNRKIDKNKVNNLLKPVFI